MINVYNAEPYGFTKEWRAVITCKGQTYRSGPIPTKARALTMARQWLAELAA